MPTIDSSSVGGVHGGHHRRLCGGERGVDGDVNSLSYDDDNYEYDIASCRLTPKVVSIWYRPPELLLGAERYDQGVDFWGAGCVMGELLRGRPLMDSKTAPVPFIPFMLGCHVLYDADFSIFVVSRLVSTVCLSRTSK